MRSIAAIFPVILVNAFAAGCSSEGAPATPHARAPVATATDGLSAPADDEGVQLRQSFGPLSPGGEVHFCQYYVLPDHAIDVARFQHEYTSGGHHIILYPTKLAASDIAGKSGAFDCNDVPTRGDIGFAYVGGGTSGEQAFPDGVAWHFEAGDVVMLESHMLNLGETPLDVDYRLNLWYAKGSVTDHVGTIFFYDNSIYIPAAGQAHAHMNCAVPSDIDVLSLAPHMHVRGTHFESHLTGGGLASPMPLVATDDWSSLEPSRYSPPLSVAAGQRFDFTCDYSNPDAHAVVEGGSKTDNEMCLLIGSYYPKKDFPFEFCMGPTSGPIFGGQKTCGDAMKCFAAAKDPVTSDQCAFGTCEKSSAAFDAFFSCVALKCFFSDKCTGDATSPDCQNCPVESCADELNTCTQTGCD